MNLDKLYKMQEELDNHILENRVKRIGKEIDKELLLEHTILALLVEVGELANTTRCFKHWSTKGKMKDEIILEKLADVWHFYLSIGNQSKQEIKEADRKIIDTKASLSEMIRDLYYWIVAIDNSRRLHRKDYVAYASVGMRLTNIASKLGFTDERVEQAYIKKHEENYRRQEEGY